MRAGVEVDVVVDDGDCSVRDLVEARGGRDRAAGDVHVRLRLQQRELQAVDADLGELPGELRLERAVVTAGELVDDHPADVVPVARVLATRVAETDDQEIERRGATRPDGRRRTVTPRVGAGLGLRVARGRLALGSARPRRPRPPRPRQLALLALLGLGLDLGVGAETVAMTVSCGSSRKIDALDRRDVLEPERVADLHAADVGLDALRDLHRQRLDVELELRLRDDAALLHAGRILGAELDVHGRLDRDVEADLEQVDVADVPRIGSRWYSFRIDECGRVWPSSTTSSMACRPDEPVSAVRRSRS